MDLDLIRHTVGREKKNHKLASSDFNKIILDGDGFEQFEKVIGRSVAVSRSKDLGSRLSVYIKYQISVAISNLYN
jgi:hypothetical protein